MKSSLNCHASFYSIAYKGNLEISDHFCNLEWSMFVMFLQLVLATITGSAFSLCKYKVAGYILLVKPPRHWSQHNSLSDQALTQLLQRSATK